MLIILRISHKRAIKTVVLLCMSIYVYITAPIFQMWCQQAGPHFCGDCASLIELLCASVWVWLYLLHTWNSLTLGSFIIVPLLIIYFRQLSMSHKCKAIILGQNFSAVVHTIHTREENIFLIYCTEDYLSYNSNTAENGYSRSHENCYRIKHFLRERNLPCKWRIERKKSWIGRKDSAVTPGWLKLSCTGDLAQTFLADLQMASSYFIRLNCAKIAEL